jgi:hypothetical protein
MNIEQLFLDYLEKNFDAIKEATDYESLKAQVYNAKSWAESQYVTLHKSQLIDHTSHITRHT